MTIDADALKEAKRLEAALDKSCFATGRGGVLFTQDDQCVIYEGARNYLALLTCPAFKGAKLVPFTHPITNEMKADCIGEFEFYTQEPEIDDNGEFTGEMKTRANLVPWDTCKQIYKTMLKSAPDLAAGNEAESIRKAVGRE